MGSADKIQNKRSKDPFDNLIFEKGLKIKSLWIDKELDMLVVVLSNGFLIKETLSAYPKLKSAFVKDLNNWKLISNGIGIHWKALDEDLSLKGFIKNSALHETLKLLEGKGLQKIIA